MGSKSQLAFIYIYTYIYIYNMAVTFWATVGPPGFKMASPQLLAYRVRARGARIVRGLDESLTKFHQGRRTTALRLAEVV